MSTRIRKGGLAERIERYVDKQDGGCWLWTRGKNAKGYGIMSGGLVHRKVYEHLVGAIPDGMYLLHKCDVRHCCNPDHLYPGTQKDNMRDMLERKRTGNRRGQPKGDAHSMSKLTQEQAEQIIRLAAVGEDHASLARHFGVGRTQVARIVRGDRWKHLPRPGGHA